MARPRVGLRQTAAALRLKQGIFGQSTEPLDTEQNVDMQPAELRAASNDRNDESYPDQDVGSHLTQHSAPNSNAYSETTSYLERIRSKGLLRAVPVQQTSIARLPQAEAVDVERMRQLEITTNQKLKKEAECKTIGAYCGNLHHCDHSSSCAWEQERGGGRY
jgi:hypothetical protein